jgi:hypothetical protein
VKDFRSAGELMESHSVDIVLIIVVRGPPPKAARAKRSRTGAIFQIRFWQGFCQEALPEEDRMTGLYPTNLRSGL